ncbi:MAG: response regulator [Candidatus Omnitrophota bacterium]
MSAKILIVDDAPIIRLMLKNILLQNGFEVIGEAANGLEAVEKYQALKPDLVTMDIVMPECDGIEALEKILSLSREAKVLMVTAVDQREPLMKAIKIGAFDYIVKPFENDRVVSAINKALGS